MSVASPLFVAQSGGGTVTQASIGLADQLVAAQSAAQVSIDLAKQVYKESRPGGDTVTQASIGLADQLVASQSGVASVPKESVDPITVVVGCGFVVGCVMAVRLVQSVWNKTETKLVDRATPLISSTSELEKDSSTKEKRVKLTASSDEVKGKVPLRQRSRNWNKVAGWVFAIRLAPSVGNKTETKLVDRATPLISSTSEFEKDSSTEEKTVKLTAPLDEVKGIALDPISKDQRIYEFILRVNSKRASLRQISKKMKPLCSEILQPTSATSLISSTSKREKDSATEEKMVKLKVPLDVKGA